MRTTPVRYAVCPWIATATQRHTASFAGVSTGKRSLTVGGVGRAPVDEPVVVNHRGARPKQRRAARGRRDALRRLPGYVAQQQTVEGGSCLQRVAPWNGDPCKILRRLPLDCHCDSGVNSQCRRGTWDELCRAEGGGHVHQRHENVQAVRGALELLAEEVCSINVPRLNC